jgi:hypothetical protein
MEHIEMRDGRKFLNGVRVYSKSEAAAILDCDKMYVAKLVDLDKIHEVGYAPYREGVDTLALFVDANSVDAYKLIFRHKDDNAPHQYVIEIMPEHLDASLGFLLNVMKAEEVGEEVRDEVKSLLQALTNAADLTEARRKYAQRKAKAKEGVTEGHIVQA